MIYCLQLYLFSPMYQYSENDNKNSRVLPLRINIIHIMELCDHDARAKITDEPFM